LKKPLEWVEGVLGRTVLDYEPMTGATSSEVYKVGVAGGPPVVLRIFTDEEWLAAEPDLAEHEAAALAAMAPSPVPTPRLLAVDETGSEAGVPAVLMTELPGSVIVDPPDPEAWLDGLADTLVAIHTFEMSPFPWSYRVWQDLEQLPVPEWSTAPELWEEMIERVRRELPPSPIGFIHRDFHPTNILWREGTVTGVIDWVNACLGPLFMDVAHCRLNLAAMSGTAAARAFTATYENCSGRAYDPFWDLVAAVEWLPDAAVYGPWRLLGLPDLDTPTVRARVQAFVEEALERLG
jgi:aminoglycoside phosphotransferase (APT) family kinase protein